MNGIGAPATVPAQVSGIIAQRSRELYGSDDGLIVELLNKFHKRLKQEFEGQQEEFFDRAIRAHRGVVSRHSWKAAQQWCKWNDAGTAPVLMPDFTRMYYRKGKTELVLQEFKPQIRLLRFKGALAKRASTEETIDPMIAGNSYTYSLALPYVIFIFKFVDGDFREVKCAFCDRPLKRLEEKPFKPYFTNLDNTLRVCLGASFDKSGLVKGEIAQQCAYILDYFWGATFSDEWGQNFWACRQTMGAADPRMASLESWQAASVENPLFVVEDVSWISHGDDSFGDMLVDMMEDDPEDRRFQEELYRQLTDVFMEEVKKSFAEMIDSTDQRIIPQISPTLAQELSTQLGQ